MCTLTIQRCNGKTGSLIAKAIIMAINTLSRKLLGMTSAPSAFTLLNISFSSTIFVVPVFANKIEKTISKIAEPIPLYIK